MTADFGVHRRLPGIVLGVHGCDEKVGEDLLCGRGASHLASSNNSYDWLARTNTSADVPMPENKGEDRALRHLDRAVIETLHSTRFALNKMRTSRGKYPSYDTVRGAFWEGGPLYPDAGFGKKNHIQIAVRNTACIKGYFRPVLP